MFQLFGAPTPLETGQILADMVEQDRLKVIDEVVDVVNGKGGITVNFSSNSAPFNMDSYVGNGKVEISDEKNLVYTIFDSYFNFSNGFLSDCCQTH